MELVRNKYYFEQTLTIVSRMKSYSKRFSWSCRTGGKSINKTPFLASWNQTKWYWEISKSSREYHWIDINVTAVWRQKLYGPQSWRCLNYLLNICNKVTNMVRLYIETRWLANMMYTHTRYKINIRWKFLFDCKSGTHF